MRKTHFFSRSALGLLIGFATVGMSIGRADVIFSTNGPGTGFNGGNALVLNQSSGTAATLTFTPNGPTNVNPPSNVNYGVIQLACPGCTTLAGGVGAFFDPFTLDVEVMVGGNSGTFTATSTGGWVYLNQSTISLHWEPSQLGPGTFNLDQGTFGPISFGNPTLTGVVAPNSGAIPGLSTVQGPVGSVNVPESSSKVEWSVAIATLAFFSRRMMRRQVN